MASNFYLYFISATIPLLVGFIYYHPRVFGNAWMKSAGLTSESLSKGNMGIIFGLTYFFSLVLSIMLPSVIIHQSHLASLFMPEIMDKTSPEYGELTALMGKFGDKFRTFTHGMTHGAIFSILIVGPILAINALFERRGWKYVILHLGYWTITFLLMGALLCQFLVFTL